MVDYGSLDVNKLWRAELNFGTVADGIGDGKAKERTATIDKRIDEIWRVNMSSS